MEEGSGRAARSRGLALESAPASPATDCVRDARCHPEDSLPNEPIFERGKFGPDATQHVALSLVCLAPGLLKFSMNNVLARAFYALNDIKTPMRTSVLCRVLNLVFAF